MPRFTCGFGAQQFRWALIALFLVLNGAVMAVAQTGVAKPEASPGLAVGSSVVFKDWKTPINDDRRLVPLGDHLVVAVERVQGDRVLVALRLGKKRGWVGVDQVVPLDRAIVYFDGVIAKDPKNADAYWMRGRLRLSQDRVRAG